MRWSILLLKLYINRMLSIVFNTIVLIEHDYKNTAVNLHESNERTSVFLVILDCNLNEAECCSQGTVNLKHPLYHLQAREVDWNRTPLN